MAQFELWRDKNSVRIFRSVDVPGELCLVLEDDGRTLVVRLTKRQAKRVADGLLEKISEKVRPRSSPSGANKLRGSRSSRNASESEGGTK